jgi:O-antigen ligase
MALIAAGFTASFVGVVLYFLPQELTVRLLSSLRVFHYPAGLDVLRFVEDNPELPMRAISTSIDPNVLGGLLILVSSLTALQLVAEKPLLNRIVVVPILATMLICLVLTFSRGAFFGFAMGLAFLGVVRYRRLLWLLLLMGFLLLILPQTQEYVLHFQQGLLAQDKATAMRLGEYKDALRLISQYPWFGVGFGAAPTIDLYIGVSSVYLLMAENMGLLGLGTFLIIMCVFFAYAWSVRHKMVKDAEGYSILLGLLTALVGALVGGLLDHYFFNLDFPHSVSLFWLFVGLAVATIKIYCPEER